MEDKQDIESEKPKNILEGEEINFLLDSEKNKIEENIIKEINEVHSEVKKEEKLIESNKTRTKRDLVDQFIDLQESQNNIVYNRAALNKMKKEEVIKAIANYTNDVMTGKFSNEVVGDVKVSEVKVDILNKPVEKTNQPHHQDAMAQAIYNINLALVNLMEGASGYCKDKTNGIALLNGWSKNIKDRKESFLIVFKLIYEDYKVDIDKYLSPMAQYAIIMGQSAAEVVIQNVNKKKDNISK